MHDVCAIHIYPEKCDTAVLTDVGPDLRPGGQDKGVCHSDAKQAMSEVKIGPVEAGLASGYG